MAFEYHFSVRGYELDSYGHVNNAVYLNYMEQARWELLQQFKLIDYLKENNYFIVVTEIHIRYSKEAKVFDRLTVHTEVKQQSPYIIFNQQINNVESNSRLTKAEVKTLVIGEDQSAVGITPELKQLFAEHLGV